MVFVALRFPASKQKRNKACVQLMKCKLTFSKRKTLALTVVQLLSKLSQGYQILRVRHIIRYSENSDLYFFSLYLHLPDVFQPIYLSRRTYLYSVNEPFPCQQLGWVGCDSEPELSVCSEKPSSVWSGHSWSM